MIARDLMTREVVTIPDDMAVAAVARVLAEAGVSAAPVTDQAHRPVGIVAELDLLRCLAGEGEAPPGWFAALFLDERALAERYTRTHGLKACDLMTRHVTTVAEDATAEAIARLMEEKGIRSVPVVTADGALCGIVSRSDLLRAVLAPPSRNPQAVEDERIRRDILEAMRRQPWVAVHNISVEVQDGVVLLQGYHRSPEVQQGVRVLAERVEGVRAVDDQTRPAPPPYQFGFGAPF